MNERRTGPSLPPFFPVLLQDAAFALRQLRKSPAFAVVVIASLALGIGASVTVFSVVRAVLLDPYPYKDADRMVHVEMTSAWLSERAAGMSFGWSRSPRFSPSPPAPQPDSP